MKDPTDIRRQPRGALHAALALSEKGDRIVYWIGPHCGGQHQYDAASAHDAGRCFLFCKRAGKGMFAYLAVKR